MTFTGARAPSWSGLSTARDIAASEGARSVGTQHVLLAILRRAAPDTVPVLRAAGLDEPSAAAALRGIAGTGCRTGPVPVDRVAVSPRVLALVREAASAAPGAEVPDLPVLAAVLGGDEPSLAHLVLSALGARRRAIRALRDAGSRVDGNRVDV